MQILNAPSRQEINDAHVWLRSLNIGIPSIRNLFHVSRLKSASWLLFLITSIPIHLLFNSSVFETTYEEPQWYLTLATEAFTQGAPFFPPGASLSPAGSLGPRYPDRGFGIIGGYGEPVSVDQYWDTTSIVRRKIASVANVSHSWTILDAAECYSEYVSCNPRRKYGDVVLIIDSTALEEGWKRSDIFTFDPSSNLSAQWNPHVPPNTANSLWFSTQCHTFRENSPSGKDEYCVNTCRGAMGLDENEFLFNEKRVAQDPWIINFFPAVRHHNKSMFPEGLEFNDKFDSFRIDHCLAQQIQPPCKVGLSNTLLLIVILSVFVKIIQGGVVAWKLPSASLVTPGDAIESFILYPDSATQGLSTLDITDAQELEPRRWKKSLRRLGSVIPYSTWLKTYFILFAGVALLTAGFAASSEATWNNYLSYQPLRVSYPAGQQTSSYRLQLPYGYSVPLILTSITLHWLVSNAVFLYINEGGYWKSGIPSRLHNEFSVSEESIIAIGFSPLFFLVLFIAGFLLIIFPPALLGLSKMRGDMVAGGWNSLVISAACHIPNIDDNQDERLANDTEGRLREDVARAPADRTNLFVALEEDEENRDRLLDLTRRKLRWGVTELQRKPAESSPDNGRAAFHLGFGGEEHDISDPGDGQCYV
ncbi:hypothetical protein O1611_g2485 [Lasiodiplodia mahajangana]|uniref:Uncharacterized protein n=1 Tax=Lasiodiplodia mahajangana TaxID=1108764 RepID=A0ACC2JVA2_9PEZI|nr:hypothetical protein O1611_g2485 [Lasiodiplodia mahajangana]